MDSGSMVGLSEDDSIFLNFNYQRSECQYLFHVLGTWLFSFRSGCYSDGVKFSEKLRMLTEGKNRSQIARDCGLSSTAITSYINKDTTVPRADIAVRIARVLNVEVEWLVDDAAELPVVPRGEDSPSTLSDEALLRELAVRRRYGACHIRETLDAMKVIDWKAIAARLRSLAPDEQVPSDISQAVGFATASAWMLSHWHNASDLKNYIQKNHTNLPGAKNYTWEELDVDTLVPDFNRLVEDNEDLREVCELASGRAFAFSARSLEVFEPTEWRAQRLAFNARQRRSVDKQEAADHSGGTK